MAKALDASGMATLTTPTASSMHGATSC